MPPESTTATQAPVAAEAAPVVEATPVDPSPESVKGLDPKTRDAVLGWEETAPEAPKAAPEPAKPGDAIPPVVTPEPTAPVVETPEVVPSVVTLPAEPEDEDSFAKNVRFHTEDKKFSAYLRALKSAQQVNPNVNPADVARLVGYDAPADEPPVVEPKTPAAKIELDALLAKIKDAARDNLGSDEVEDLRAEYADKLADFKTEQRTKQLRSELDSERKAETERSQRVTARESSKANVLKDWPTADDDTSALGKEITLHFNRVMALPQEHPDRQRLAQDDGPEWINAEAVKSKLAELKTFGLTEAQATAALKGKPTAEAKGPAVVPPPPQVQPVPRNILVTAPGGASAPEPQALDAARVREATRKDPKLRDAALFGAGDWVVR